MRLHDMFRFAALDCGETGRGFRKSYKSPVTSGAKLWSVELLGTAGADLGRNSAFSPCGSGSCHPPRCELTENHEAIVSGDAFFVCLRNDTGNHGRWRLVLRDSR